MYPGISNGLLTTSKGSHTFKELVFVTGDKMLLLAENVIL